VNWNRRRHGEVTEFGISKDDESFA